MNETLKPNKRGFCNYSYLSVALGWGLFLLLAFLALRSIPGAPLWVMGVLGGLALLSNVLQWVLLPVQFQKEEYHLKNDRILVRGGSLFSSFEQELLVKNITHITLELPFLEHQFAATGSIHIQSAGGDQVEVHMRSVANPEQVYEKILELLRKNGFSLRFQTLIREDKPVSSGVWLETIFSLIAMGGGFLVLLLFVLGTLRGNVDGPVLKSGWELFLFGASLLFGGGAFVYYIHGFTKSQRYLLYDDATMTEAHFYKLRRSLIPMENLADSSLEQGIVGRILNISNLSLSCQGSGQEITFNHVADGLAWKEEIDTLVKSRAAKRAAERKESSEPIKRPGVRQKTDVAVERDESFTASFKMDKRYLFLPVVVTFVASLVFLGGGIALLVMFGAKDQERPPPAVVMGGILALIGLIALLLSMLRLVAGWISYKANVFYVRETGFEQDFQFLVKKKTVFNAEKVTGIILKEGVFDRMLGTCSVEFWSIGASDHLRFVHIHKDPELIEKIKAKAGIYTKTKQHTLLSSPSLGDILKSNFFFYVFLALLLPVMAAVHWAALAGVGALFVLPFLFASVYYKYHIVELYDDQLWCRQGIFLRTHYYIRYDDIKYISSTRYPMSAQGTITFDVTGERVIETDKGKQIISNRFRVPYVSNVEAMHLALDKLMAREIELDRLSSLESNPTSFAPRVILTSSPHSFQFFLSRSFALIFLDIILVGGGFFLFFGGAIPAHEVAQLKLQPPFAFLLNWGLPLLMGFNVFVFVMIGLYVRSISYVIDEQKVSKLWGVFFKRKLGIHYVDIDYIGKHEGAFNKAFSTSNITVNTVGSSATDLTLHYLSDGNKFYDMLKEHYQHGKPNA